MMTEKTEDWNEVMFLVLKRQTYQVIGWMAFMALSVFSSAWAQDSIPGLPLVQFTANKLTVEPSDRVSALASEQLPPSPTPFALESLKSTSSVVLTEKDFLAWWEQHLSQMPNHSVETKSINDNVIAPAVTANTNASHFSTNFHPISLNQSEQAPVQGKVNWLEYILKPGDVISIQVLGHPEFSSKNVLIAPDSTISMPLLGKVSINNSSAEALTANLTQGLGAYLRHPVLTITLEKISPQRVYVLGAVKKPGLYLLDGQDSSLFSPAAVSGAKLDYHLSAALVKAGGLLADADLSHVKVFNFKHGYCSEANIVDLLAYGALPNDLTLVLDDVIYVPRLADAQWNHPEVLKLLANSNLGQDTYPVRVYGFVTRPDVYQLSPTEMTLQSVLAKAGIDLDRAQPKGIIVARTLPNQQMLAMKIDSTRKDMVLFPNDAVIVSKSNWKHWTRSAFGSFSAITLPVANLRYILDNSSSIMPWF